MDVKDTGYKQAIHHAGKSIDRYQGPWGPEQISHLIRRCLFGMTYSDQAFFQKLHLEECLDVLLTDEPPHGPPVNAYNSDKYTDPNVPFGKTWVNCPDYGMMADVGRLSSLYGWWTGLMLNQSKSLSAKMSLFWHNHIACELQNTFDARASYAYLAVIMKHSLGNSKAMMLYITTCTGMLSYLSGNESTAEAPNENYSREMQELFTVGKGPDSHYTQADIRAAARVLTGWTTTPNGLATIYNAAIHDSGDKHFSAFYGHAVIKGKTGQESANETEELIDIVFANKEVARHTCRCLYRWFVAGHITDQTEQAIIHPLAEILIQNNYEIKPVLGVLLSSAHFYDMANIGVQIKNPVDYLVGACRQFGVTGQSSDLEKSYKSWISISDMLSAQSMRPGEPPNVAGWPAYYLSPAYYQLWINSDTIVQRNIAIDKMLDQSGADPKFDLLAFAARLSFPADVDTFVSESWTLLSQVPMGEAQRSGLTDILNGGGDGTSDSWGKAWTAYAANSQDDAIKKKVTDRLVLYFDHILKSAQYHLM